MDKEKIMLTDEQGAQAHEFFTKVWEEKVIAANRPGAEKFLRWLETTDFFAAPASTSYHGNYRYGLVQHSVNVYKALIGFKNDPNMGPELAKYGEDTLAIIALCHDICKANFYKETTRNVKNEETGKWEKVPYYTVEDAFPMGHGEKSVYLMNLFMRLKTEEAVAIRWHMGGFDSAVKGGDYGQSNAWNMYPLGSIIHMADLVATYMMGE